jgi:hypothetical protein
MILLVRFRRVKKLADRIMKVIENPLKHVGPYFSKMRGSPQIPFSMDKRRHGVPVGHPYNEVIYEISQKLSGTVNNLEMGPWFNAYLDSPVEYIPIPSGRVFTQDLKKLRQTYKSQLILLCSNLIGTE